MTIFEVGGVTNEPVKYNEHLRRQFGQLVSCRLIDFLSKHYKCYRYHVLLDNVSEVFSTQLHMYNEFALSGDIIELLFS